MTNNYMKLSEKLRGIGLPLALVAMAGIQVGCNQADGADATDAPDESQVETPAVSARLLRVETLIVEPTDFQEAVQVTADDAGLGPDAAAVVHDPGPAPVGGELGEDTLGDRLPRQGCSGGPEGEVLAAAADHVQQGPDLVETPGANDGLGDQAVDRGVGRAAEPVDRAGQHALGVEHALNTRWGG